LGNIWVFSVFWGPKGESLATAAIFAIYIRFPTSQTNSRHADRTVIKWTELKQRYLPAGRSMLLQPSATPRGRYQPHAPMRCQWSLRFEKRHGGQTLPGTKDRLVRNTAMGLVRTSNVHVGTCQTVYLMRRSLVSLPDSRGPRHPHNRPHCRRGTLLCFKE
jgi:hypothetical protein